MDIDTEISNIFKKHDTKEGFNPSECRAEFVKFLDQMCLEGNELDPRVQGKAENACNVYGKIARTFMNMSFPTASISLLVHGWNHFSQIQYAADRKIYKAAIAYYLADLYLRTQDLGAAFRWAILAQGDDALAEHYKGSAYHQLHNSLSMSNTAIEKFDNIAKDNKKYVTQKFGNQWSNFAGFAEDIILRFVLKNSEFAHLYAFPSSEFEFPLNSAYFNALLDRVKTVDLADEKGKALEDVACYLFLLIPGWVPQRNLQNKRNTFETDVLVSNLTPSGNLSAELFGRDFLVECKNWADPVGSNQVGYFLYRMRLTHTKFGVIFASKGITGTNHKSLETDVIDKKAAFSLIDKAFHEDGSICVVVDQKELETLGKGQSSFFSLLIEKTRSARFGRPRYS